MFKHEPDLELAALIESVAGEQNFERANLWQLGAFLNLEQQAEPDTVYIDQPWGTGDLSEYDAWHQERDKNWMSEP